MPNVAKRSTKNPHRKRQRARIYIDRSGNQLAAMTETMWTLRNAMRPEQVLQRAGLTRSKFWNPLREKYGEGHFIFDYLRRKPLPSDAKLIFEQRGKSPLRRSLNSNEAYVTKDCQKYRKAASLRPVCESLQQAKGDGFTDSAFNHYERLFERVAWYEGWQFYFENAPTTVLSERGSASELCFASEAEVRRMRGATSYSEFLRLAGANGDDYGDWIDLFPARDVGELFEWIRFLFGDEAPDGWYVVPLACSHPEGGLRTRMSPAGVTTAAGNSSAFQLKIEKKAAYARAVEDAITANRCCRDEQIEKHLNENSQAFKQLVESVRPIDAPRVVRAVLNRAKAQSLKQALADIGYSNGWWNDCKRDAEKAGGSDLREQFVNYVTGNRRRTDRAGVVAPGLLVMRPLAWRFREIAAKFAAENRLSNLFKGGLGLCRQLWFLDNVLPQRHRENFLNEDGPFIQSAESLPEPNGPVIGGAFRWNCKVSDGLKPLEWRLVDYLWKAENRSAPFEELAEPVWQDAAIDIDQNRFGGARKRANRFFAANGIPANITGSGRVAVLHVENGSATNL